MIFPPRSHFGALAASHANPERLPHDVMGEAMGENASAPIAAEVMLPQEESTQSSEGPSTGDWVITKISRVKNESSSSIPLNERDISKGCQSIKTAETNNTAVTTSCDEEEELVDTAIGNEEEHSSTADEGTFETTCFDVGNSEGSAFETFDANTRVYHRNVEIFKPDDPPQRSIPPPELGVKGAIALDHRVLSSSSKESSFSIFSGTTNAADSISNIASVLENSVFSEDDEAEKKHAVHSKHRHAIFCFLVLILLVGATAFIFFGTGLANSMKEKSSPRGQEGTDTSVTTSSDDDSTNPSPGPVTSRETGI